MAKKIKIPIVHHPKTGEEYAFRAVPHYAGGIAADGEDLPDLVSLGCLQYTSERWHECQTLPTDWIENPVWTGVLSVISYWHGRSSSCYYVQIDDGSGIPIEGLMSCSEFIQLIPKLVEGKVGGTFKGVKRGQNYLIELDS